MFLIFDKYRLKCTENSDYFKSAFWKHLMRYFKISLDHSTILVLTRLANWPCLRPEFKNLVAFVTALFPPKVSSCKLVVKSRDK